MHGDTIHKIINLILVWIGISLVVHGMEKMDESGYTPPETPSGWVMGIIWICVGMVIALTWSAYIIGTTIHQKINNLPRLTMTKLIALSFILIFAAMSAVVGTYLTWKHPFRLGPCDCDAGYWGRLCKPCQCGEYGVCDDGQYGTGRCACNFGFDGDFCQNCDIRHKPEPWSAVVQSGESLACDQCKTGYIGEDIIQNRPKCDQCDIGYAGEECDICDEGWMPWQYTSELFPLSITKDDNRHICDECRPNHWGYYCRACPWGNDVPHITLEKNNPIIDGTRVLERMSGKAGAVVDMQVYKNKQWNENDYNYQTFNPKVLKHTRVKIKYDIDKQISSWITLSEIRGVQCNNRGTCIDDDEHQRRMEKNGINWEDTCTWDYFEECSSDRDCLVSENCKGVCQGIDLPISSVWEIKMSGTLCKTDEDCIDPTINIGNGETYVGGRCVSRGCCKETHHGSGNCDCNPEFFGPLLDNGVIEHYQQSPSCDFCPGYDWETQDPTTICSGGKGTCSASYSRTFDYVDMRCTCSEEVFIDRVTGILQPDKIIAWSGNLCECGDFDEDGKCDICAAGHWGKDCSTCPGGPGLKACGGLGKGQCFDGVNGDGTCNCRLDRESSWMLAPYEKRYDSEKPHTDANNSSKICSECAPNFYGEFCLRCEDTDIISSVELSDIYQPAFSYELNIGQSSAIPQTVCHRGFCTLACGGGGWCNWGRQGDGSCMCWSNLRLNNHTWNPLDNVCIGNKRYEGTTEDYKGEGEQCPAYGYCLDLAEEEPETGRKNENAYCGTEGWVGNVKPMNSEGLDWTPWDDWNETKSGEFIGGERVGQSVYDNMCRENIQCWKWMPIDWRPSNSLLTCVKEGN